VSNEFTTNECLGRPGHTLPTELAYNGDTMGEWGRIGKHRFCIEGDIFVSINEGPVSLEEMQAMMSILHCAVENDGVRYFLMNLTRAEAPSPEARRWMTQNPYRGIEATAGYGASRTLRILSDLMRRAMELLQRSAPPSPFRLFETETEARAYFTTLRLAPKSAQQAMKSAANDD
jgi:hypothetical protein